MFETVFVVPQPFDAVYAGAQRGVPLEIVQKVTGHRTASIVMKHYFQPGREDFRRTLAGKMPALLVGEAPKVEIPEIRTKLKAMSEENWQNIRDKLLANLPATLDEGAEGAIEARPPSLKAVLDAR